MSRRRNKQRAPKVKLIEIIRQAVVMAEMLLGGKPGEEKKTFVVSVLNKRINIPGIPETVEGVLLSFLIDLVVDEFNDKWWPDGAYPPE